MAFDTLLPAALSDPDIMDPSKQSSAPSEAETQVYREGLEFIIARYGDAIRELQARVTDVTDGTTAVGDGSSDFSQTDADALYLTQAGNLLDVASASTSRGNLGLGTIATQDSDGISITGGTIDGTVIGSTTAANITGTDITGTDILATNRVTSWGGISAFNTIQATGASSDIIAGGRVSCFGGLFSNAGVGDVTIAPRAVDQDGSIEVLIPTLGVAGHLKYFTSDILTWKNSGIDVSGTVEVNGTQVLGPRITGWSSATAPSDRSSLNSSDGLTVVRNTLSALIKDLFTHGIIGI